MSSLLDHLNTQIAAIRKNIDEIGNLPDKVDNFCGILALSLRSRYIGTGIFSAYSTEQLIKDLYRDRDDVNSAIRSAWSKLQMLDPDLEIPVQLLTISDEWRNFKGLIQHARGNFDNTDLSKHWEGDAANAYVEVRERQQLALVHFPNACEQIAQSLEGLALSELQLYSELAINSREIVTATNSLVGQAISANIGIVMNPMAIAEYIDGMNNLATTMENIKTLITGTVSAISENAAAKIVENNMIGQSYSIIDGLHNNKWPAAVSEAHPGGLRDMIGDATTSDGDQSDWQPGTTTVVAPA